MKTMTKASALSCAADILHGLEGSPTVTEVQSRTAIAQAFIALGNALGKDDVLVWDADANTGRIETRS